MIRLPFARVSWGRRAFRLLGAWALLVALASCQRGAAPRLVVVASIAPVGDLVARIAGPDADVVTVVPAGATVPPGTKVDALPVSPEVKARATDARLAVVVGLGFDDALVNLAKGGAAGKTRSLRIGDRVPTLSLPSADGLPGAANAFVWTDPQRLRLAAKAIAEEMAKSDGAHAAAYRARAEELDKELAVLDGALEARLGALPRHDLAVSGPEIAYFAERYHLDARTPRPDEAGKAPLRVTVGAGSVDLLGSAAVPGYTGLVQSLAKAVEERLRENRP